MKKHILIFLILSVYFILLSCASTDLILNSKAAEIDFNKIKTSNITIYCADALIEQSTGFAWSTNITPSSVVDKCFSSFKTIIPTVVIHHGTEVLPGTYSGKLSLKFKEEMNVFLSKHSSHYIFIVSNLLAENNLSNTGMNGSLSANNKYVISFQLWDVKNKSIILDYDVKQTGEVSLGTTIDEAVSFIDNNGIFDK